jgi:hypothetical protein
VNLYEWAKQTSDLGAQFVVTQIEQDGVRVTLNEVALYDPFGHNSTLDNLTPRRFWLTDRLIEISGRLEETETLFLEAADLSSVIGGVLAASSQ